MTMNRRSFLRGSIQGAAVAVGLAQTAGADRDAHRRSASVGKSVAAPRAP